MKGWSKSFKHECLHDNFFGTVPVWIWPRCLEFAALHPPFLSCKWKNSRHEFPKTYGGPRLPIDMVNQYNKYSVLVLHIHTVFAIGNPVALTDLCFLWPLSSMVISAKGIFVFYRVLLCFPITDRWERYRASLWQRCSFRFVLISFSLSSYLHILICLSATPDMFEKGSYSPL